jgi:thiamine-monophosphate kinase
MQALAALGVIRAAIDNSDGLLPSLGQLAEASAIGIELDLELLSADRLGVASPEAETWRLALGWGDWNVVAVIAEKDLEQVKRMARQCEATLLPIGWAVSEHVGEVRLRKGATTAVPPRLESERFATDSWFQQGIDGYVRQLLDATAHFQ